MNTNSKTANYDWAKDIPCKNITIYGYCKHEDKCAFKHDLSSELTPPLQLPLSLLETLTLPPQQTSWTASTPTSKVAALPIFTPTSSNGNTRPPTAASTAASLSSNIVTTSLFAADSSPFPLTLSTNAAAVGASASASAADKKKFNFDSPSFTPTTNKFPSPKVSSIPTFIPTGADNSAPLTPIHSTQHLQQQMQKFNIDTPSFSPSFGNSMQQAATQVQLQSQLQQQASLSNNDIFYQQQVVAALALALLLATTSAYPLQYHLYSQLPPPHFQIPLAPYERDLSSLFIPNHLRQTLQRKNEASNQILGHSNLPDHINNYHSLVPIDTSFEGTSKLFGVPTSLYKVQSSFDGKLYCLRRIELMSPIIEKSIPTVKKWAKVNSANVIKPKEAFTSMAFNDNSLFLVYDYYPCSSTLIENHFQSIGGKKPTVITETLLWSYIIQLTNAIIATHAKGMAIRCFDLSKIIVTSENRIRLSGCGVLDILEYQESEDLTQLQQTDISKFGELILSISSTTMAPQARTSELSKTDLISILPLSDDFKTILKYLNSENANLTTFQQMLAPNTMKMVDGLQNSTDFMESQLSRELENGRLFRLITKLNFIVERPEFAQDESWSETGERYPIKLFRDYVFHQYDEMGRPLLDLNHVLTSLNKLDAGIDEKLLLVSGDEKSCLIMSYKELKDLVDSSFRELNK